MIPRSNRRQFLKEASIAAAGSSALSSVWGSPNAQGSVAPDGPVLVDYGRFTDRALEVLRLSEEAAHRWHSEYLASEHILLGLLMAGDGVGIHVLMNLGIGRRRVQVEIEKLVPPGPPFVTTGKLPKTPRARNVIEFSRLEARELNHDYVGTEHILLGLLREDKGVAAQVLMNLGLKLADVRTEALNLLSHRL